MGRVQTSFPPSEALFAAMGLWNVFCPPHGPFLCWGDRRTLFLWRSRWNSRDIEWKAENKKGEARQVPNRWQKKKSSAGSQEYQPEMFEKFVFSKLPVFQHKYDKVTVSGGFIPFSSPSDSVHYHLIFHSCSVLLSSPWRRRRTIHTH